MTTSKQDLRREIKALREQVAKLERNSKQREDRLVTLLELVGTFFPYLKEVHEKEIEKKLEEFEQEKI